MTLGSLFDGIAGFPLAAQSCGIEPLWASEIEPTCIEITKRHFPNMTHLGSVTDINGADIPPVDIISFGSPCQDLSIAGKQTGLDGERSGLFMEAVRVIREMRGATNGLYPAYAIWENVPGAFSSNKGDDFRRVLESLAESEIPMPKSRRWAKSGLVRLRDREIAWRTIDAQYWGVPQRRKRIYLVVGFGGRSAGEILFKPESLLGYTPQGGETGQETPGAVRGCAKSASFSGQNSVTATPECAPCLRTGVTPNCLQGVFCKGTRPHNADEAQKWERATVSPTLNAFDTGEARTDVIVVQPSFCIAGNIVDRSETAGANGVGTKEDCSYTLNTIDRHAVAYCIGNGQVDGTGLHKIAGMLNCMHDQQAVIYAIDRAGFNQGENAKYDFAVDDNGINSTLTAKGPSAVCHYLAQLFRWVVRRLTPRECERLQGFPDDWTRYDTRGKEIKDSHRYKALGNSIAIPCAIRVFRGIVSNESL